MKSKVFLGLLVFTVAVIFLLGACAPKPPPKDKIRIGRAVSLTGPNSIIAKSASIPIYDLWVDEVNAAGGIYVKQYKKRLPLEVIVYDDESDHDKSVRLMEKLIVEDKVDFILPPCGTQFLFGAAPVANRHGYILMGAEGGALKLNEYASALPYFFAVLNFADTQMPALAEMYKENGIKSVAMIYIDELHGVEYSSMATAELDKRGIAVKMVESVQMGVQDLSPLLQKAKELDVDAFLVFSYPGAGAVLAPKQAIELGINFKAIHTNVAANFGWFAAMFGEAAEGVMGGGGWNCKIPEAKGFCDKFIARYGEGAMDWWGHLFYWAGAQIFQQSIEKAGTLDQEKIRDVMAKERFNTALGPTWFENGLLAPACHPGEIGQWQKGVFEVVAPKEKATAKLIYPKPAWPEPKPEAEKEK